MSSSDYTNYETAYAYEEPYYHTPARERPRDSAAFWLETPESTEYNQCYCALCDRHFKSLKRRERHVARSSKHPYCEVCDRRFLNGNALRAHRMYSYDHFFKAGGDYDLDKGQLSYKDMTWETHDEFDCDDFDYAGDEVHECIAHLVKIDEEEEQEEEQNESGPPATDFTCPICEHTPKTVCSTLCGHMFCAPCIKMAFDVSGMCPVCDEEGNVNQLRKMYISS